MREMAGESGLEKWLRGSVSEAGIACDYDSAQQHT
jgi:hypothetical protein